MKNCSGWSIDIIRPTAKRTHVSLEVEQTDHVDCSLYVRATLRAENSHLLSSSVSTTGYRWLYLVSTCTDPSVCSCQPRAIFNADILNLARSYHGFSPDSPSCHPSTLPPHRPVPPPPPAPRPPSSLCSKHVFLEAVEPSTKRNTELRLLHGSCRFRHC